MWPGKRRALVAAAVLLFLVAGLAVLWRQRLPLAEALVRRTVAAFGLAGAEVRIVEIAPGGALLEGVRVGEAGDLTIARVALRYSLLGLVRGRIGEVAIGGLQVTGRVVDGKLSFGALDAAAAGGGTPSAAGAVLPPVDALVLSDAVLAVSTPDGVVRVRVDGEAEVTAGAEGPQLALRNGSAAVTIPRLGSVTVGGIDARVALPAGGAPHGEIAVAGVRSELAPPIAIRLAIGSEAPDAARKAGALPFTLELTTADGRVVVTGPGELRTIPFAVSLALASEVTFAEGGLQPADLSPLAAASLASAIGTVKLRADVKAGGAPLAVTGRVETDDLSLVSVTGVPVEGLAGRAEIVSIAPLRTKESTLRFRSVNLIGPFESGEVRWRLAGSELEVMDAAWTYAGGRLTTAGRFDLAAKELPFTVAVSGVSLETLLAQLEIADLSGSGTLSGSLPLVYDFERLRVEAGVLTAEPPGGVLRYAPASAAPGSLGLGGDVDVLAGALEDFHYDKLRMELSGALDGDVEVALEIDGKNPRYESGRPVELNVTVKTNLPALLRASRSVTALPEVIEKRLRDRVPVDE